MAIMNEIVQYANELLEVGKFKDYGPNGLQLEGREQVARIVSGVTASQALIDEAIAQDADMLLVHHGYFWRNEAPTITGIKRKRIAALLAADISLVAYHLPLDAHPIYGNNAQLAQKLGIQAQGCLVDEELVMHGSLGEAVAVDDFCQTLEVQLGRKPLHISGGKAKLGRVAWCSGGAQGYFESAIKAGVDAYITGEVSEQNFHLAKEYGVDFFSAGHHATEKFGVKALGDHLAERFDIKHTFVDIANPV